jgi:septal ring factor EnvC (AmiA/AmiB activator)
MNNVCAAHQEVKDQLRDHEKRIVALEKANAEFAIRLQNLIEKIDSLTGWIKALVISIVGTGVGFIIWYIQSLPRG